MYQEFYRGNALLHLPLFTLCLFLAIFAGVVAWVFLIRRGDRFDALARLPFAEGCTSAHQTVSGEDHHG